MAIERQPADIVIGGLKTTSDKIRKLARAGYSSTEISKLLGIRYQHARKVLVDAGIADGLRGSTEAEESPIAVPSALQTSSESLLRAGFRYVGEWTRTDGGAIVLDARVPTEPGVYAFALDDVVVYVGLTQNGLRTRMDQYRLGHKSQRTNARVNSLIAAALVQGRRVKVLTAIPETSEWNGLPVNTSAGLEAGLIQTIRLAWNIQGAK